MKNLSVEILFQIVKALFGAKYIILWTSEEDRPAGVWSRPIIHFEGRNTAVHSCDCGPVYSAKHLARELEMSLPEVRALLEDVLDTLKNGDFKIYHKVDKRRHSSFMPSSLLWDGYRKEEISFYEKTGIRTGAMVNEP